MTEILPTPLQEPLGYILLAFSTEMEIANVLKALEAAGISEPEIQRFRGPLAAESVETESRWFADTHEDLRRFYDVLADGGSVIAVKDSDAVTPERVMDAIGVSRPIFAFHFGQLMTKSLV